MSKRKGKWRFALQILEGPNAGLGAGSWRVWATRSDIYVASRGLAQTIKASLHESGLWRIAYTEEHMAGETRLWSRESDRAPWKFSAPPFEGGVQDAFVIATWRNALRPCNAKTDDVIVAISDRWDVLTGVKVVVTEAGAEAPRPEALVYDDPLQLANGKRVWLEVFEDPALDGEPEPIPDGQLVRVLTPEADGVPCPGFLMTAFRIG